MRCWMFLQKLAIVRDRRQLVGLDVRQRIGQRHVTVLVVMPVGFAVGRDVHELRITAFREAAN